ncbi:MAG: hypothetical protein ACI30J_06670 [Paludibacteraceae bacterium]
MVRSLSRLVGSRTTKKAEKQEAWLEAYPDLSGAAPLKKLKKQEVRLEDYPDLSGAAPLKEAEKTGGAVSRPHH